MFARSETGHGAWRERKERHHHLLPPEPVFAEDFKVALQTCTHGVAAVSSIVDHARKLGAERVEVQVLVAHCEVFHVELEAVLAAPAVICDGEVEAFLGGAEAA
jgi:hypothetical protein